MRLVAQAISDNRLPGGDSHGNEGGQRGHKKLPRPRQLRYPVGIDQQAAVVDAVKLGRQDMQQEAAFEDGYPLPDTIRLMDLNGNSVGSAVLIED